MGFTFLFQKDAFSKAMKEAMAPVQDAATAAVKEAAETAVQQGQADIATSGRFGSKWVKGLKYKFYRSDPRNPKVTAAALVYHKNPITGVFEYGATIQGKPILWLPIEDNAGGVTTPKRYKRGKLVSVNVRNKPPMLFDKTRRVPVFVGVPQSSLEKRWHIMAIVERAASRLGEFFVKNFKV